MSTDGSKFPVIRGTRVIASGLSSSARRRTSVSPTVQPHVVVDLKDTVETSAWNPYTIKMNRYREAADRVRLEQPKLQSQPKVSLQDLQQRHSQSEAKNVSPPPPPSAKRSAPPVPNAADILKAHSANSMVEAHFNVHGTTDEMAARLSKAQILTAASRSTHTQHSRQFDVAARAQRVEAANRQSREEYGRDLSVAKNELNNEQRRQKYLNALAEEHAKRAQHSRFVRDLLLESYTHQYDEYEAVFTKTPENPFFLETYPTEVPLVAGGKLPKLAFGASGVPHGQALKLPNQSPYDHKPDQYNDEVRPFYTEDTPFEYKKMAGPLTIKTTES